MKLEFDLTAVAAKLLCDFQNLWPVSLFKYDDLRASDRLVRRLSVPESTKSFVFAARIPEYESVIYILATQSLSERSARDAECLIKDIQPDAVIVQVENSSLSEMQTEESGLGDSLSVLVPTSSFEVLRRCFLDKFNKEKYEIMAGNLVLREIFGTSFYGHLLAAQKLARETGSSFLVLESSAIKTCAVEDSSRGIERSKKFHTLISSLAPQKVVPAVHTSSRRFVTLDSIQSEMVKSLSSHMKALDPRLRTSASLLETDADVWSSENCEVPSFAQPIFPLLVDLYNTFYDLPLIERALGNARKMFSDVDRGEAVAPETISEVYAFRVAVEGLRIALNNVGRLPLKELGNPRPDKVDFSQLQFEDKSNALLAHALRVQGKDFKTIVAVVDARSLAGIRKHWNTSVPTDVKDLVGDLASIFESEDENIASHSKLRRLFSDRPVVAVGAGATAVLGASALPKIVPASTIMKFASFKIPVASLKLLLTQTQKTMAVALSKTLGPSKVVVPGLASSGSKTSSAFKAVASAEKIRAVTHSMIASIEKTSFSAMRTAFYEIMRKRRVRPIGFLPWATLGCSVATCAGLAIYGDGFECVAESVPSAPSIACLGRGIQSLHAASQAVSQTDGNRIQKAIESLMYRLKKVKIQ